VTLTAGMDILEKMKIPSPAGIRTPNRSPIHYTICDIQINK